MMMSTCFLLLFILAWKNLELFCYNEKEEYEREKFHLIGNK